MSEHSKEPWKCIHFPRPEKCFIVKSDREIAAEVKDIGTGQRIVHSVNACAGMDDPVKEIEALKAEVERLKKFEEFAINKEPHGYCCKLTDEGHLSGLNCTCGLTELLKGAK